ncbi:hypothetical protein [Kribbella albertanoniae]|uniref:Uncharacterized protein n=1 Tax=Kribbella albertanoniae TaxID=1266829 RepID=A0A4R4Q7D4_9ACTN|nr:hypothetical protein [Kribbella albertanoniae]TDC30969.1 hypothetical protein E1261_11955 [Kribbella albertanoniae]
MTSEVNGLTTTTKPYISAVAYCPAGTTITGVGFSVHPFLSAAGGTQRRIVVRKARPVQIVTSSGVVRWGAWVSARRPEQPAHNQTYTEWGVIAKAYCSSPLAGHQIVRRQTTITGASEWEARAECPQDKVAIGSGYETQLSDERNEVVLDSMIPGVNSVSTKAFFSHVGGSANWILDTYAICAYPVANRSVTSNFKLGNPSGNSDVKGQCPLGTLFLSPGFDLVNSLGQVRVSRSAIENSFLGGHGWSNASANEDLDGTDLAWTLQTFAVCATI